MRVSLRERKNLVTSSFVVNVAYSFYPIFGGQIWDTIA